MIISSGASGTVSLLSFVIGDVGDVFLVPSPYYTAFDFDVGAMANISLLKCPLLEQENGEFRFSVEIFEKGYKNAIASKMRPRAIILVNPQNPLGDVYDEATLRPVLEFAAEKQLHVIVDEIYALSVFIDDKPFESVLNYDSLPDPARTHFLWSFSKDFALSGTRIGVLYAGSLEACNIGSKLNFLMVPSPAIQHTLQSILDDHEWTRTYIRLNRSRLAQRYRKVKQQIEQIDSEIRVRDAQAGLFLWIDFSSTLHHVTFDEETRLFESMFHHGVYVTKGSIFDCSQPGWFRLVFTVRDKWIDECIKRMKKALNAYRASSYRTNEDGL